MLDEEWRPVVGWEGLYEVSSQGRMRSLDRLIERKGSWYRAATIERKKGRVLACTPDANGYPMACLYRDGDRFVVRVHSLVAEAFIGPCPAGMEVAHQDGQTNNPAAANLRYDTRRGNISDKVRHGTRTGGEKHSRAKLTQTDVDEIKLLRAKGLKYREIATMFSVHPTHIGKIIRGGRWNP